jgi:hypothetical protein
MNVDRASGGTIDVSALPPGHYLAIVSDVSTRYVTPFVIAR